MCIRDRRRKKQERDRRKQKNIPTTAQQSIPYIRMLQDGICQVTKTDVYKRQAVHRRICRLKGLYCLWDCRFDMYRIYREKNY